MQVALLQDRAAPLPDGPQAEALAGIGKHPTLSEPTARDINRAPEGDQPPLATPSTARRDTIRRVVLATGKRLSTLAIALVAILISLVTWQHYVTAPWTRNGSVRVQVANVASQVSGKIVELRVAS